MSFDPYLRPSGILHNTLGIDDPVVLTRVEANAVLRSCVILFRRPDVMLATWDLRHLQRLHRLLFGSIYPWAGDLRTIDIAKDTTRFANAEYLQAAAADTFGRLLDPRGRLQGLDRNDTVSAASALLAELNLLHPFREGNGRAQRAFLQLLVLETGSVLRWDHVTPQENVAASIRSVTDDDAFTEILDRILEPADTISLPPLSPQRTRGIDPPRPPR